MDISGIREIFLYPPSFDQIILINSPWQLWFLRVVCLAVLIFVLEKTTKLVLKNNRQLWLFRFLTYFSGAVLILGYSFPWDCLKIVIVCLIFLAVNKLKKYLWFFIIASALITTGINFYFLKSNIPIFNNLSVSKSQEEVNIRFFKERQMNNEALPTLVRRIGYNKYSLILKTEIEEVFKAGDVESLFFQEVHPLGQKSIVLFFYSAFGLFVLSLWLLIREKISMSKEAMIYFGSMGIIYFSLADGEPYRRLFMIFIFLSMVIAVGTDKLLSTKGLIRNVVIVLLLLNAYGIVANSTDMTKRPDYWLDNRPLFYKGIFQMKSLGDYPKIVVADMYGLGEKYCHFYRTDCSKYEFDQNDLRTRLKDKDNLLVGFWGSFASLKDNTAGYRSEVESFEIRDNIASGFGTKVVALKRIILPDEK